MSKIAIPAAALVGVAITAAAVGFGAATAHASFDYANQPAGAVANTLQSMGYSVQINGATNNVPLSSCRVTAVNGLAAKAPGTVYLDVSCPNSNNS